MTLIAVGQRLRPLTLFRLVEGKIAKVSTNDLFSGRRVVLFGVPGAFTPTCSEKHLPGFVEKANEIKAKGIAEIFCVSTNDAFVMHSWGKAHNVQDHVSMIADGNGDLARELGVLVDLSANGLGAVRNKRYGSVLLDGVVQHIAVDTTGLELSSANAILNFLTKPASKI
eukprot:c3522_g1_i2.p1 GENE.c3522_g1_i2~~c3522_g1_i2.p1  ORF type:complete len:185 (-),score=65.82 c3522_g1_i2:41-547(-)